MERKRTVFLVCGCSALATHQGSHDGLKSGHPSCPIHDCCEIVEPPNLDGRYARCPHCGTVKGSKLELPFFAYESDRMYDSYYCGCRGWD